MRHFHRQAVPVTDTDIFLVEVAALCHDLGHGPFSHTFQGIFLWWCNDTSMLKSKDIFVDNQGIRWTHEEASSKLLDLIVKHDNQQHHGDSSHRPILTEDELLLVRSMIEGTVPAHVSPEKKFMWQIVANKTNSIDVDKFDYLQRDCYSAGMFLCYITAFVRLFFF